MRLRPVLPAFAGLVLVACAGEPEISRPFAGEAAKARRLLVAAARGPVRLDMSGLPPTLVPQDAARLAAEGVSGAAVTFTLDAPAAAPRLLLAFDPVTADPLRLCAAAPASRPVSLHRLTAVLCDGSRPVASVDAIAAGPTASDTERLVWRTTARLFPDDYPDTYGLNLFGSRLRVGVGGSFGF